jgi:hypothetical protein
MKLIEDLIMTVAYSTHPAGTRAVLYSTKKLANRREINTANLIGPLLSCPGNTEERTSAFVHDTVIVSLWYHCCTEPDNKIIKLAQK